MKYKQRLDNEGWQVKSGDLHKIACCDCGLVHRFIFISDKKGNIGIAAVRDKRATAAKRRKLK